jgi:hypothetical protein
MRRQQLQDLPYEQRQRVALLQQRAKQMADAQDRLRKKYRAIAEEHTPKWALWISRNIPPRWYIKAFHVMADNMPPQRLMYWIVTMQLPRLVVLAIFVFFKLPLMILAVIICSIFLKPFDWLRKWMADLGLQSRLYELSKFEIQLVVKKRFGFGKEVARITERM